VLEPLGYVRSSIKRREDAPRQGNEGAPDAWLDLDPRFIQGLEGIEPGDKLIIVTWLHRADRTQLRVHPRNDLSAPFAGVFATRSPDRPNPLGLHEVTVKRIEHSNVLVGPLEALDGTPVVDIKPVL
jgi:tRNA-Thr(GGU) m(6)t(6)A37 methyltransferase TsaA